MLKVSWLFVHCLRGNQTFFALCVQKLVVLLSSAGDKSVAPIKCCVKVCLTSLTVTSNNTELAKKAILGLLVINHCLTVVNRGGKTMSPWLLLWSLRLAQCVPCYWEMWGFGLITTPQSGGRNLTLSSGPLMRLVCYLSVVMSVLQGCSPDMTDMVPVTAPRPNEYTLPLQGRAAANGRSRGHSIPGNNGELEDPL